MLCGDFLEMDKCLHSQFLTKEHSVLLKMHVFHLQSLSKQTFLNILKRAFFIFMFAG